MKQYKRISIDPNKMSGVPCIRDLRMPVATIIAMLAEGLNYDKILSDFPELELEDITESLKFASDTLRVREYPLAV